MTLKWICLSFVCFFCMGCWAGEDPEAPKPDSEPMVGQAESAVPAAGMVVVMDAERGALRSPQEIPAELRDALEELVNTSTQGLEPVQTRSGAVVVDLRGRFYAAMVVTKAPDGSLKTRCVTSEADIAPVEQEDQGEVTKDNEP